MRTYIIAISVIAVLFSTGAALADDFADAFAAYQKGDYATALDKWKALGEKGDALAQFNVGAIYFNGQGTQKNFAEAARWYKMSAEKGNAQAANVLGMMYKQGDQVPKDLAQAVMWFRKAAEAGDADAQNSLGTMLVAGEGSPKNEVEAYAWFTVSLAAGEKKGEQNLKLLKAKLSPKQIETAEQMAKNWKPAQK